MKKKWIALDLVNLHNSSGNLVNNIKMFVEAFAFGLGYTKVIWDDDELAAAVTECCQESLVFYQKLGLTEASHLKFLGFLLYTTTQLNYTCIAGVDGEISDSTVNENLNLYGCIEEYTNESLMFIAVYRILNAIQSERAEPKRYDPLHAPFHPRYFRSITDYLRDDFDKPMSEQRDPFSLYMILKSMDLIGVDCNYNNR